MKLLFALIFGILPLAAQASVGVCTYSRTATKFFGADEAGYSCNTSEENQTVYSVYAESEIYLNGKSVRTYTAEEKLPTPILCKKAGDFWSGYGTLLYSKLEQKMAADCAKLQAGGACVCLGKNVD